MPYEVSDDPYIDQKTGILRNLLGATSQLQLDDAEARTVSVEAVLLTTEDQYSPEDFTLGLFMSVHKQLFGSIYDWAGELRTVDVSKGSTSFARAAFLETNLRELFVRLQNDEYCMTTDFDEFVNKLTYYYGELIILHPFREGNGRAIRTFLTMLAESIGWHIAWDEMSPQENIQASIAVYSGDDKPLRTMLSRIVTAQDVFWGRDPYEFI